MRDPIDILARTIWGEARGETLVGKVAVAMVVMNRAARARWWGGDVASVCLASRQFSCWGTDDPNRAQLIAVDEADPAFAHCRIVAELAVEGLLRDPTGGADHYHRFDARPVWAADREPSTRIGRHWFYRLEG